MIICLGCMTELNTYSRICPYCGYDSKQKPERSYFLEPGTILNNRYVIGKSIGSGGFGITYIAFDAVLNRKCAIKEYYPREFSERPIGTLNVRVSKGPEEEQYRQGLNSFLSEARKLAEFANIPQIVDVYDCIRANRTGYIIMEYIPGMTIREIMEKQGRYPYKVARDLVIEVLKGLVFVHRANIIHRDIAPDNIMMAENGQVKLIDFGASRQVIADRSQNYDVILKPGYAPVEQYSTTGKQGPWTDVYAVGATFYRMITGEKPPDSQKRRDCDSLEPPSRKAPGIPGYADRLILNAMEVRREDRIQSAENMLEALVKEKPAELPNPFDYLKYVVVFIMVMIVMAFLVCFGLEKVINGNNVISGIMSKQSVVVDTEIETDVVPSSEADSDNTE